MPAPTENNPLWMLRTFYFVPCDLMHQQVKARAAEFFASEDERNQSKHEIFLSFMQYWFASLFVVAEGWKEINIKEPSIDKMIDDHWNSLRLFRNAVFHFQLADRKHVQFFNVTKFAWAEELHAAFRAFFEAQQHKTG